MDARVVVSPKPTAIGMVQGMKKILFPYAIYLVITMSHLFSLKFLFSGLLRNS
jgi:hypothetical protein